MTATKLRPGVLCVGRLYCDLIFTDVPRMPSLGTEIFAGGLGLHAGGGAYITAAWLVSLGHRAALASYLPPKPFTEGIEGEIARSGVDLSLCHGVPEGHAPQVTVSMASEGDRAFLTHRPGPPFPNLTAHDIRASGARHVHIGEATTLVERPELLVAARQAEATVSLDCGWDDDLETADLGRLLSDVDIFLPNAAEAHHLTRLGVSLEAPALTVIKRGAEGASASVDGCAITQSAPVVRDVDTTGAGDAFNAGFLSAWLAGEGTKACLSAGNATGARAVSARGGFHSEMVQKVTVEASAP